MPLDALCLSGLVHELDQTVTGGKIDKIYQPGRDEILLAVRTPSHGNVRLLLSANPNHPRPQLTQISRENPDTPPMFCMLLRKHLSGARLLAVEQPPLERVVMFTLEALNELGDRVERRLVLEAIGRRSNLILLDESGRILDCMRRVESSLETGKRQSALPAARHVLPPPPSPGEAGPRRPEPGGTGGPALRRPGGGPGGQVAAGYLQRPVPPGVPGAGLPGGWSHRRASERAGTAGRARLLDGLEGLLARVRSTASPPPCSAGTGPPGTSPSSPWPSTELWWSAPPSPPFRSCWTGSMSSGSTWSG